MTGSRKMPTERISRQQLELRRREQRARRAREHEQWMKWLLAFERVPLGALDIDRAKIVTEAGIFATVPVADVLPQNPAQSGGQIATLGSLVDIQQTLTSMFEALWPSDATVPVSFELPVRSIGMFVARENYSGQVQHWVTAAWPSNFWWVAIGLLEVYGARVRRCTARSGAGKCGRLFLRKRRQLFCSPACSRRELARRWYERHRSKTTAHRRAATARRRVAGTKGGNSDAQ
jgi:hypothetical protein